MRRLFRLIRAERRDIGLLYLYAIIGGLISLALPLGIQAIFNFVSFGQLVTSWFVLMLVVIVAVGMSGGLQVMQLIVVEHIQRRIFVNSAFEFAYRIPRLDTSKLSGRYVPELVNRFFDTVSVQKSISKLLMDLPSSSLQIFFGLALLSLYHPLFLVFGLVLVALLALLFRVTGPMGLRASLEESKYKYKVAHWLEDLGRSLDLFKVYNHTDLPIERTDGLVDSYLNARKKHFSVLLVKYWMMVLFKLLIIGTLLVLGSILVRNNEINIGQLVASEIVIILLINSVEKLILSLETVYDVLTALEKIGYVTDMELDSPEGHSVPVRPNENGYDLKFANLSLHPNKPTPLLRNLNADIRSGEVVRMGSCNSASVQALLQILVGYREDFSGTVTVNGVSIKSINKEEYRKRVAPMFSDRELFDGTILENIVMDSRSLSAHEMGQLMGCMQATGLESFIERQVDGLKTRLLPQGEGLPGSIRSKLVLTRALITDANLLILHSPFRGLNHQERERFLSYLREHRKGVTAIIVSDNNNYDHYMDAIIDPQCTEPALFPTID